MAEVLTEFDGAIEAPDGSLYHAQVCGGPARDGTDHWEGWIEFVPVGGGTPLRSRRETTQPNRKDTLYWATGLSPIYVQGTLKRTLEPGPAAPPPQFAVPSMFEGPAPSGAVPLEPETPTVLNPFSVYRKGEALLRKQLAALSAWHLVNIVRGYELSDVAPAVLERTAQPDLIDLIVASVALRAAEEH